MIEAVDLTKRYGKTVALDRLNLTIPEGGVFGLLGPNGSGKSTLMKLITGFIFPDLGQIVLNDLTSESIGYLPERLAFPPKSRLGEYLALMGRLSGSSGETLGAQIELALRQVGLNDYSRWRIEQCSKGMLQRLGIAQALLTDPPFLLLDEPMGGLDPTWQRHIRKLITYHHQRGKTILFSSHRLSDVTEVCTHVGILNRGQLVREGQLAQVLPHRPQVFIRVASWPEAFKRQLEGWHPSLEVYSDTIILHDQAIQQKATVLQMLLEHDVDVIYLEQKQMSLEEVYMEALDS